MTIDEIKRQGAIDALRTAIGSLQHFLANDVWGNTVHGGTYKGLGTAITRAERKLTEMRKLLEAIQDLDPNHD